MDENNVERMYSMNNQKGFTLIEMLIVLMIIATLLLVTIPNLASNNSMVEAKGCEAMVKLAETQVQAYKIEKKSMPADLATLVTEGYLEQETCPGGEALTLNEDGTVTPTLNE